MNPTWFQQQEVVWAFSCQRCARSVTSFAQTCCSSSSHSGAQFGTSVTDDPFKGALLLGSRDENSVVILRTSSPNHLMLYFISAAQVQVDEHQCVINKICSDAESNGLLEGVAVLGTSQDSILPSSFILSQTLLSVNAFSKAKNPVLQSHGKILAYYPVINIHGLYL